MSNQKDITAKKVFDHMMEHDLFSQWLGIEVLEIKEGYSKIKMTVRKEMINGFGIVHGGIAFSLADSAFAFACNNRNVLSVALDTSINFIKPVHVDDELVDIFLEEAEELLDGCENSLERWNSNNADAESVKDLQRQLHTLKGGARMADLSPIGDLTHSLESLVIAVNDGLLDFSRDMFHLLHGAMDRLSDMVAKVKVREPIATADQVIEIIEALRRGETVDVKKPDEPDSEAEISESDKQQEQLAEVDLP